MTDKEEARKKIEQLIHDYRSFSASQDETEVNEERVKIAFVVPLLETLGWNMRTDEVLPEQRTLVGAADFGLRAYGATPQIYVECKSFRENLDGHRIERGRQVTYAEKAIQYAWSMKANWAILTNFKKTRLYYSLVRRPSEGLVFPEISFNEYVSRFDELWLVSKDSVLSGEIETYRKKATRNHVDEEFLKDLIECRQLLLDSIHKNNPDLTTDDMNESAQRILDRIVFVRSCEDRNIIPAEMLWKHYAHWEEVAIDKTVRTFMTDLKNMFRDFDRVYNGKLFEPHLCEDLRIDNPAFRQILERLYGDGGRTGYRFDAIPVNVLGQAYELYIGSVIKEKAGAVKSIEIVEDYKKRQEHGIYYTPTCVTHFIARQTLGRILRKAKTGDEILKVKLLDQAAGSGSFLIEAFDQFRDAYLEFKREYQERAKQGPFEMQLMQPEWVDSEKATLQNNIYGVDLDPQAVETTTLSLELKAVKTKERIPHLGEHIKRGNSIVNHTADEMLQKFSEEELKQLLGEDWRAKWQYKHPFKYSEGFKEIMDNGGFDVVVGNPPYNNMRDPELKVEQAYCERFHDDIFRGNSDILFYFIKSGLSVLRQSGLLGLIVARYFMKSEEADRLRKYILDHSKIRCIVDTRNIQVFGRVNVLTCIIALERDDSPREAKSNHKIKVINVKNNFKGTPEELFEHISQHIEEQELSDEWIYVFQKEQGKLSDEPWTLEPPSTEALLEKIRANSWELGELCQVGVGYDTELNEARLDSELDKKDAPKHGVFILAESEAEALQLEKDLLVKMVKGFQIQRYALLDQGYLLLNTSAQTDIDRYPNVRKHLARFRRQLEQRDAMPRCLWFGVGLPKNKELFEANPTKILVPKYATGNKFAYDDGEGFYCISDAYIVTKNAECRVDLRYVLAILNSKMMEFYHKKIGKLKRGGYYEYFAEQLRRLPIKKIDLRKRSDKAIHDRVVRLVGKLIDAKKRLLFIEKAFAESIALYPTIDKLSRLKTYYEYEGVHPDVLGDFNRKRGKIHGFKLSKEKDRIRMLIDYFPEESENEKDALVGIPALDLRFETQWLCNFVYHSLRNFSATTSKRMLGKGNILRVLQSEILVPSFATNRKENREIIRKIMNRFETRTKGLLGKHGSLEQFEVEIQTLDNEVETEVRNVYEITEEENDFIEGESL